MKPRIFISYRREDTSAHAGRIYDRLAAEFGSDHVFFDVDAILPGADFSDVVIENAESCDALVAVIGKSWLTATDVKGKTRIQDEGDYVAIEIATALRRKIPVIPVLVAGGRMPAQEELPGNLLQFARKQAHEVPDKGFIAAVERLISILKASSLNPDMRTVDTLVRNETQVTLTADAHSSPIVESAAFAASDERLHAQTPVASTPRTRFKVQSDRTDFARQLEDLFSSLGARRSNDLRRCQALLLVRGNDYQEKPPQKLYSDAMDFVVEGGLLVLTSFVSWETNSLRTFRDVLPFEHQRGGFEENTPISISAANGSGLQNLFSKGEHKISNSFELLRPKRGTRMFLWQNESIPLLGSCSVGKGECIYLNSCQHFCLGKTMVSPLEQSVALFEAVRRVIEGAIKAHFTTTEWR